MANQSGIASRKEIESLLRKCQRMFLFVFAIKIFSLVWC
jgi:hypothetical protein